MKEIWGFAWFATALCAIALVMGVIGRLEAGLPAFFCFIPVVFFMLARTIQNLTARIARLEEALGRAGGRA